MFVQAVCAVPDQIGVFVGFLKWRAAIRTARNRLARFHPYMRNVDHLTNCVRAPLKHEDIEVAVFEGAVQRLRPKLMTISVVLASLIPILWETGVGSDVMKPIAAPIVGGMITSTIHVLILVPVFFAFMKERALRRGTLQRQVSEDN
jgi:AcrB/AcrD/AcrF family